MAAEAISVPFGMTDTGVDDFKHMDILDQIKGHFSWIH